MSFDVLQDKIKAKKNPTAVGLDARMECIPTFILEKHAAQHREPLEAAAQAALEFSCGLIDALESVVPAVKLQSAYFELLGWRGMKVLEEVISYAQSRGLFVIADVKRGDIGTAAAAYSGAWLGKPEIGGVSCSVFGADCATLNGYMGSDAVKPFLKDCAQQNKCAFILAKTSTPSSTELQDIVAGDRLVYTVMGDLIQRWGQGTEGRYGYQALGAMVGSASPAVLKELRYRLDKTFFLVSGFEPQKGAAADVSHAFDKLGRGAIVSVSRPILCAWQETGNDGADYQQAARAAAEQVRDQIKPYVTIL